MLHTTHRALPQALIICVAALVPGVVHAEVSDKMPTLVQIWIIAVSAGLLCLVAAYFRGWLTVLVAALPMAWFFSLFSEIHSMDIRPALLAEAGQTYYVQAYLAALLIVALGYVGWMLGKRRRLSVRS